MTIEYEILIWPNSPDENMMYFDIVPKSTKPHLEALSFFKSSHEEAVQDGRDPDEMPYISVKKHITKDNDYWGEVYEYGEGCTGFDGSFEDLPKYVQKQIAPLVAYEKYIENN